MSRERKRSAGLPVTFLLPGELVGEVYNAATRLSTTRSTWLRGAVVQRLRSEGFLGRRCGKCGGAPCDCGTLSGNGRRAWLPCARCGAAPMTDLCSGVAADARCSK